jgi:hypothetical protein
VNIVTLAEGDITHLHIGFKGTMNALFLKDLADKNRRGLRGRVEAGKSSGGLCYGYRADGEWIAYGGERAAAAESRERNGNTGCDWAHDGSNPACLVARFVEAARCRTKTSRR